MADTKFSALPAIDALASGDEFAANDVSAGASKKVTAAQIKAYLAPTLPTVVAVTAEFSSTGVPTATLPTGHAADDILVLVIQSSNDGVVGAPGAYQQLGPQNGIGTGAAAGANRLSVFWKRDGGSESAPTIPDTGDHTYGFMFAIRGCPTTGDPFIFGGNNFKFTTSTSGSSPKSVTHVDNTLVVDIFAGSADNAAAEGSSLTNADLTNLTEQFDDGTTDGTGGFLYMSSGAKAAAGPVTNTTVTWANTSVDLCSRIHFLPADTTENFSGTRAADIHIFIGSPQDTNDTWIKPTGARKVQVQLIGGGGGGSSGHTVTTPAGGGGGGGGGYSERWFNANDVGATETVHPGKGGAATTVAVDQAGNAGVDSTFGSFCRAVAGTGAGPAASADGGNGGSGGGISVPAAAALQTIAAGELGTAGGNGTTTGVAGSPGQRGGGGGSSGTTAANATIGAGLSKYGGGGGGAGANTGTLTAGGAGGAAAAPGTSPSTNGVDSTLFPYGGSGATGGNATTAPGGAGGFPGGGGGGGGGNNAGTQGGRGGHGCVVVTTYF